MQNSVFWKLLAKKLSGEASAEEVTQFEFLLRENAELVYKAEQVEKIWRQQPVQDHLSAELAFEWHISKLKDARVPFPDLEMPAAIRGIQPLTKWNRTKLFVLASFSVLLFFTLGYLKYAASDKSKRHAAEGKVSEISAPLRSKTKLVLPDSTVVWLNAGSKLTYNEHFGITNRNTTLVGEAFFDVKKSSIPFIIHANAIQIKVLGTVFNVKCYPNENYTETTLVKGRIEVTMEKRPGELIVLKPNEKLIVDNDQTVEEKATSRKEPIVSLTTLTRARDSSIVETSWMDDKLAFQDETFSQLAKQMERWYGVTIQINDETVAAERLSGTLTTETVREALDELKMTTPFHYVQKGNLILITQ